MQKFRGKRFQNRELFTSQNYPKCIITSKSGGTCPPIHPMIDAHDREHRKKKIAGETHTCSKLVMKYAASNWAADANNLQSAALVLCYSVAELITVVQSDSTQLTLRTDTLLGRDYRQQPIADSGKLKY